MIKLRAWSSTTKVAVNPLQVTHVKDASTAHNPDYGCVIYFANEKSIHVSEDYLVVVTSLENALKK